MIDWAARARAHLGRGVLHRTGEATDETDERVVLSVSSVGGVGDSANLSVANARSSGARNDQGHRSSCAVDLHHVDDRMVGPGTAWTASDIQRYLVRRERLLRWGWPEADAEAVAERLTMRDQDALDDRVSCFECGNFTPGHCARHRAALLDTPAVGRQLAVLLQRCPAHTPALSGWKA